MVEASQHDGTSHSGARVMSYGLTVFPVVLSLFKLPERVILLTRKISIAFAFPPLQGTPMLCCRACRMQTSKSLGLYKCGAQSEVFAFLSCPFAERSTLFKVIGGEARSNTSQIAWNTTAGERSLSKKLECRFSVCSFSVRSWKFIDATLSASNS